jgi:hypothetical protein
MYPLDGSMSSYVSVATSTSAVLEGLAYGTWEKIMPRIPDPFLDCVVYLYETVDDARVGTRAGGSGFAVIVPYDPYRVWIYVVSNRHVVSRFPVIRLNTSKGEFGELSLDTTQWIRHPDGETDLAIASIDIRPSEYRFQGVLYIAPDSPDSVKSWKNQLITESLILASGVGVGDDAYLVGRFVSHEGTQRNLPTARFGAIAQMPYEVIQTEAGGQQAFLVEVRSIAGYSGSPVFVRIPAHRYDKRPGLNIPLGPEFDAHLLLGVDCAHLNSYQRVIEKNDPHMDTGLEAQSNTGMAVVIPAWKLAELLDCEELKAMRDNDRREMQKKDRENAVLDSADKPKSQRTREGEQVPIPSKRQFEDDLAKATQKRK